MEVKAQEINLLFVATRYQKMKHYGKQGNYRGLSPFTEEKTPSFVVNPKRKFWKCFSTGKGGKCPVALVMEIENCSEEDAINKIKDHLK